jgi:peptide/nickel transport system permease protein
MIARGRWLSVAGQHLFVLLAAVSLNFALPRLMPGNPLELLAGKDMVALSADDRAALLRDAGLDRSLAAQYFDYLGDLARGDLGFSYQRNAPVTSLVIGRLPLTLLLTVTSQLLALVIGVACALLATRFHQRTVDAGLMATFLFVESLPVFWIGMVLLALFAVEIPLFPAFGAYDPRAEDTRLGWFLDLGRHLVLPVATLSVAGAANVFLVARASLLSVLEQPFVSASRAKGLSVGQALSHHVLPNAMLPLATVLGMNLALAVGGATLVETVFAYPGLGRLIYEAVLSRDYPVLQAAFLLITAVVILANAAIDVIYPSLDPRVRGRTHAVR